MAAPEYLLAHTQKTAGTSFSNIFKNEHKNIGVFSDVFDIGRRIGDSPRIISSHFPFSHFKKVFPAIKILTFLRNPINRFFSQFYHHKEFFKETNYKWQPTTIEEMYSNLNDKFLPYYDYDNAQVRNLSGFNDTPFKTVNSEMLSIAKENLSNFCFFGITECWEESVRKFLYIYDPMLNIDLILATNIEKLKSTDPNKQITETELQIAYDLNRYDLELYVYAFNLFKKNL